MRNSGEYGHIARHAGTVLVGQLSVMAFGITDTVVAGRHSDAALAALSVGSAIYISVFVALNGMLQSLLPVWAELHGARQPAQLGRSFRQALYLCAGALLVGAMLLQHPGPVLTWTQVPPAMQGQVVQYLDILALALLPSLLFRMYGTLNQSLGKPRLVTLLQAAGLLLKIPLSVWLTFGGLGLPGLGVAGCAWATLLVNCFMVACAAYLLRSAPLYAPYALWQRMELPDWKRLAEFVRLGVPGGLTVMVEVTSFTLMALFVARLGTAAAAAHQIASNVAAVLYMVPLSLGLASSARVSFWLGAGQPAQARVAVRAAFALTLAMASVMSALLLGLRAPVAQAYAGNPLVQALAGNLLVWVALYHFADAIQAVGVFVLRSYRITLQPMLIYGLLLWGLGLAGGYLLTYGTPSWPRSGETTPRLFWMTSAFALALTALIFSWLLLRVMRRQRQRARA